MHLFSINCILCTLTHVLIRVLKSSFLYLLLQVFLEFSGLFYCSVINVLYAAGFLAPTCYILPHQLFHVNNFFQKINFNLLYPVPACLCITLYARNTCLHRQKSIKKHTVKCTVLTEKEGFEPSRRYQRPTPFPGEPLLPLGYFCLY